MAKHVKANMSNPEIDLYLFYHGTETPKIYEDDEATETFNRSGRRHRRTRYDSIQSKKKEREKALLKKAKYDRIWNADECVQTEGTAERYYTIRNLGKKEYTYKWTSNDKEVTGQYFRPPISITNKVTERKPALRVRKALDSAEDRMKVAYEYVDHNTPWILTEEGSYDLEWEMAEWEELERYLDSLDDYATEIQCDFTV